MTVDRAFALFESSVRARGLALPVTTAKLGADADRAVVLEQGGAGLRLTWNEEAGRLSLDVTHGPLDGPPAGWLDLYRAALVSGRLRADQSDFDFADAVDHGLSLLASAAQPCGSRDSGL